MSRKACLEASHKAITSLVVPLAVARLAIYLAVGLSGVNLHQITVNLREVINGKARGLPGFLADPDLYVKLAAERGFEERQE